MENQIPPQNDIKLMSQLFYYLQDISLEIQSARGIVQIVHDSMTEYKKPLTIGLGILKMEIKAKGADQILEGMLKIALHNVMLNLCKAEEAVSSQGRLVRKYCPEFQMRFNNLVNEYKMDDIRRYRNIYLAHPHDKTTKKFAKLDDLKNLYKQIFNSETTKIDSMNMTQFSKFLTKLHCLNETDPNTSLVWAIRKMADELSENGIEVQRS